MWVSNWRRLSNKVKKILDSNQNMSNQSINMTLVMCLSSNMTLVKYSFNITRKNQQAGYFKSLHVENGWKISQLSWNVDEIWDMCLILWLSLIFWDLSFILRDMCLIFWDMWQHLSRLRAIIALSYFRHSPNLITFEK